MQETSLKSFFLREVEAAELCNVFAWCQITIIMLCSSSEFRTGKITLHDVKIHVFVFYLISVHLELGMC